MGVYLDCLLGGVDLLDHGIGATPFGTEEYFDLDDDRRGNMGLILGEGKGGNKQ
jgi:hypothetical protein